MAPAYLPSMLFSTLLALHIAGGALGLLAGTAVIARAKGDRVHRRIGRAFAAGMITAGLTSLVMAVLHPNVFLFIVGVFTLYLVGTGMRYNRLRGLGRGERPAAIDYGLTGAMAVFGVAFLAYGGYALARGGTMGTVLLVFGAIGLLSVRQDVGNYRGRVKSPRYWLLAHVARMMGAYIAALTAFLVVNAEHLPSAVPGVVWWLLPTAVLVPFIVRWNRGIRLGRR